MDVTARGRHAEQLLKDEVLIGAFSGVEQHLTEMWKAASNSEDREEIWFTRKGLERAQEQLTAFLNDAVMESHDAS